MICALLVSVRFGDRIALMCLNDDVLPIFLQWVT